MEERESEEKEIYRNSLPSFSPSLLTLSPSLFLTLARSRIIARDILLTFSTLINFNPYRIFMHVITEKCVQTSASYTYKCSTVDRKRRRYKTFSRQARTRICHCQNNRSNKCRCYSTCNSLNVFSNMKKQRKMTLKVTISLVLLINDDLILHRTSMKDLSM